MISDTSNTWFPWFPVVCCHTICIVPDVIMSRCPLSNLHCALLSAYSPYSSLSIHPKWHPIPYIVHYFKPKLYGSWSKVVHYIGNREPKSKWNMIPASSRLCSGLMTVVKNVNVFRCRWLVRQEHSGSHGLCLQWHNISYIVHYFWPGDIRLKGSALCRGIGCLLGWYGVVWMILAYCCIIHCVCVLYCNVWAPTRHICNILNRPRTCLWR
jgi:hypothetical protein